MQRVERILDDESHAIADLQQRLSTAPDESSALEIMRQIEATKRDTEIQVLRAQAELARGAGKAEQAERIEAAVQRLEH